MKVSICIPTYNRPEHLKQAIDSCLAQSYKPFEIIVSDDSSSDDSEMMLKQVIECNPDFTIRYKRNKPGLRQVKNVNQLFDMAIGDYIVLLHDDDLLHPDTLTIFNEVLLKDPSVEIVYGKQYIIDDEGNLDIKASKLLNEGYCRTAFYEKNPLSPIEAGLLQQFPNDAYMLKSLIAKDNKYSDDAKDACDYEFALRLGVKNYKMFFVNQYTGYYRVTSESVSASRDNDAALTAYNFAKKTKVPEESIKFKNKWMRNQAPIACMQAIDLKNKKEAISIYLDQWHRKSIFTLGGIKRLLKLITM